MIGIVILNYQNWKETQECITSIMNNDTDLEEEYVICVVDNNSTTPIPDELDALIEESDNIHLLKLRENGGFAKGNNRGYEYLRNHYDLDFVIITNSDIIFYQGSISGIARAYREEAVKGISFPKIFSPDGEVSYKDSNYYQSLFEIYRRIILGKRYTNRENAIDINACKPIETHLNMGSCFAMDKEAMERLLPLDENTTLYYEEMILSYRADKEGICIFFNPTSTVLHKEGKSTGKGNPFVTTCLDESIMYYSRKYLEASRIKTFPLFLILNIKYGIKSIRDKNHAEYTKKHFSKVWEKWIDG